jgi:nucleoside-diphosphate-sugar epimerase
VKVAVTGGTGCLGRPLLRKLLGCGLGVRLLVIVGDEGAEEFPERVEVVSESLESEEVLRRLTQGCEVVFHLAGKVHAVPRNREEEKEFYEVNVKGTKSVVDAATINKVKRVIFYSTVGVYGKDADFHGDEFSPCRPESVYAKNKYEAESLILNSHKSGGPEGVVLRLPVAYGPLDRGNVASLIRAVDVNRFFYFGDGKAVRSMISSANAAEAALKAALEPSAANQIFCVTDGTDHSVRDLVESICSALGKSWRPHRIPISLAELMGQFGSLIEGISGIQLPINSATVRKLSRPLTFSCEKARRMLGYKPRESLAEGIKKEVDWLKTVHGWK